MAALARRAARRRPSSTGFRADLAGQRDLAPATLDLLRACAGRGLEPMDALRVAAGTISLAGDDAVSIVAPLPDHRRRLLAAARRQRAPAAPARPRPRRQLPLHAERRDAGGRTGPGPRDLPQHRGRPWAERVDVHGPRDHLHRLGSGLGGGRRPGRAQGAAARRRPRTRPRHGVRDRRGVARRGGAARQDRPGREADGLRPPRLQGARSRAPTCWPRPPSGSSPGPAT